jgi:hypothetical protein
MVVEVMGGSGYLPFGFAEKPVKLPGVPSRE